MVTLDVISQGQRGNADQFSTQLHDGKMQKQEWSS